MTLALSASLSLALLAPADVFDLPEVHVPIRAPSQRELDHIEGLKWFLVGQLHERSSRLLEAVRAYEAARKLDPDGLAIYQALIPLYLALDRPEEAEQAFRRALELDPDDHHTAFDYARHLRSMDKTVEARAILVKTAARPSLRETPELNAQVHYDLGLLCEQAGDLAAAEEALRTVLTVLDDPATALQMETFGREDVSTQAADTAERLGRICLAANHPDGAVAAFELARQKDPVRSGRLALNMAEVLVSQKRPTEALARLDEYLRTQPLGMEGYELQIKLLRQVGRPDDVLPALEASSARDPYNTALRMLLAREYQKAKRPADAEQIYRKLIDKGTLAEGYRGLFGLYKEDTRTGGDRVLKLLDDAMAAVGREINPVSSPQAAHARAMLPLLREDPDLVKQMLPATVRRLSEGPPLAFQTRLLFAGLATRARDLTTAEALFRSCLADTPPDNAEGIAELTEGLISVLIEAHKYEAVVPLCRRGLARSEGPRRSLLRRELAVALLALDKPEEALQQADAAVREAPEAERLTARRHRIQVLSRIGKHTEAIAECQALAKEYNLPGDVRAIRMSLSLAYSAANESDKAEEQLRLLLEADPNDAVVCNDLGFLYAEQGRRLDEAERLVRRALELDRHQRLDTGPAGAAGDNAAYVDSLGWVLFRRGKTQEACQELERAITLPGGIDDPTVWDHLGDVYEKLGRKDRAVQAWRKSETLYEDSRLTQDEHYRDLESKLRRTEP